MTTFSSIEKKIDDAILALHHAATYLDDTGDFESESLDEAHRMAVRAVRLLEQFKREEVA